METKHKLIEVLNNFDTHDAREAVRLFHSEWTFRFRPSQNDEWNESPSYSFSEFLDEDEAARNCASKIDDILYPDYRVSEVLVQLQNIDLQVDRMFMAAFGYGRDPVISDHVPSSEPNFQV